MDDIKDSIQKEARSRVISILQDSSYNRVSKETGINTWFLWMMVNRPDYKAPAWVYNALGYRLTPKRCRIEIQIPSPDEMEKIKSISKEERLRLLLEG